MALYIIIRHAQNPDQRWENRWLDARRIDYIHTKATLADLCEIERLANRYVYIHRCGYKNDPREIVGKAKIKSVDLTENKVTFCDHQNLADEPPIRANQNQIYYFHPKKTE